MAKELEKTQTLEEMELELKKLEIEERKANLQDVKERLAEREMLRTNKQQRSKMNGQTIKQIKAQDRAVQAACNHHKGGNAEQGIVYGQGDDPQYAVLKHQFQNGDIWVRCLRCGKTWKPPVKKSFYFNEKGIPVAPQDGKFDDVAYHNALKEYKEAVAFQTRNSMSTSYQFQWHSDDPSVDVKEWVREQMEATNLR